MIYWDIFLAFFIPGILGYGGGPASIPLVKEQVVDVYGWMTVSEFSEMLAVGNALPGPIATKMAGYIGYQQGGILGASVGLFATIAPSLLLMIGLLALIMKYKDSPRVKRLSIAIRPTIAILLGTMAFHFFAESYFNISLFHTILIGFVSYVLMEFMKVNPVYVIIGSVIYGAILLG
ncbi:chromate transporter [Peribacillus alkalitolerans]|uniref:chromate transporter n=1 Tax=Peribacillus alkalitolerans TaxID=1550385 RepID=UPI0013D84A8B|nr:chromate transporter [Peribacillus alkalitolerans]